MRNTQPANTYDPLTITLHWFTAFIVIFLFVSYQVWSFLPRGTPVRHLLQSLHVSAGIVLALLIVGRLIWRLTKGRRLPAASTSRKMHIVAKATHGLLYLLILAQVALGFLLRWAQEEPLSFFDLFTIPDLLQFTLLTRRMLATLHFDNAWIIIILAGGHAVAALAHHYLLRDGTLRRMIPRLK
ncbi:cytochrome B561 [[Pantoea] beijingensis]|uniref:Cytochrome B561 n=1 Tax=[Pantoea] beijingensis TaxID=1324864 RepID=A0A443IDE9_9GAMM|nr:MULTISPECIES: cytochrome b [Erwiniaceae]RWR02149.1 cytochrome B561 [[Pantoea] beijingensis]